MQRYKQCTLCSRPEAYRERGDSNHARPPANGRVPPHRRARAGP